MAAPTLEFIQGRCRIDDDGCWIWTGSHQESMPTMGWSEDGKKRTGSVRRLVFRLAGGKEPGPKKRIYAFCDKPSCVSPDCAVAMTVSAYGQHCVKRGLRKSMTPRQLASLNEHRQRRLSHQAAAEIRASDLTGVELAKRYGVSTTAISRVRLGQTYAGTVRRGASVFNWRG